MISYHVYNLIHFSGVFLLLMAIASLATHYWNGGTRESLKGRRFFHIAHGLGMFLILLGGFGMLARLGIHWPWPNWIIIKFAVWIALGGVVALIPRFPNHGKTLWLLVLCLAIGAALTASYKI